MPHPACQNVLRSIRRLRLGQTFTLDTSGVPPRGRANSRSDNHAQGIARLAIDGEAGWLAYTTSQSLTLARLPAPVDESSCWSSSVRRTADLRGEARFALPPPPRHDHVGGLQAVGDTLVVASSGRGHAALSFYTVSGGAPTLHSRLDVTPWLPSVHYAGLCWLPSGHALCFGARDQRRGRVHDTIFFESTEPGLPSHETGWNLRGVWRRSPRSRSYQSATLLWDHSLEAPCFVGLGPANVLRTRGRIAAFHVHLESPSQVRVRTLGSRRVRLPRRAANFDAGASVHVTGDGRLLVYAIAKLGIRLPQGTPGLRFTELVS